MALDSDDIFMDNIFQKYEKRSKTLENVCLAEFASKSLRNSPINSAEINIDQNESLSDSLNKKRKTK